MDIDPDEELSQLNVNIYDSLATTLNANEDWMKLALHFELFDQQEIRLLSALGSPGNRLLSELGNRLCSIDTLRRALKNCQLYDALALISPPERLSVIKQPDGNLDGRNSLIIANGEKLKLEFIVAGIPPPKFSWFKDGVGLPGHNTNTFLCDNFHPNNEGTYYCCACQTLPNGEVERITSNKIKVEILPFCLIKQKPQEIVCIKEGSSIFLQVDAVGYPELKYQWIRGNSILNEYCNNFLYIEQSEKNHGGEYRCIVSNRCKEICLKCNVIVYSESAFPVFKEPVPAKLALLIGNANYENHGKLKSPAEDVQTLADILEDLNFTVYCLANLSLEMMRKVLAQFVRKLEKGALVFFYFSGHGFQLRSKYLLPVNAPSQNEYMCKDAICEDEILKCVLETQPALFICLLDMCLKLPIRSENPPIFQETVEIIEYKSNRNLIQGYATTSHGLAYEIKNAKNGVYANALRKYMKQDDPPLPILTILEKVNTEIAADSTIGRTMQMPSFYANTAQNFYLNLDVMKTF